MREDGANRGRLNQDKGLDQSGRERRREGDIGILKLLSTYIASWSHLDRESEEVRLEEEEKKEMKSEGKLAGESRAGRVLYQEEAYNTYTHTTTTTGDCQPESERSQRGVHAYGLIVDSLYLEYPVLRPSRQHNGAVWWSLDLISNTLSPPLLAGIGV